MLFFKDWWDWLSSILGVFGLFPGEWLHRTGKLVSDWWSAAGFLFESWFTRIAMLVTDGFSGGFEVIVGFWYKINLLFEEYWLRIREFLDDFWEKAVLLFTRYWYHLVAFVVNWYEKARTLFEPWWYRIESVFSRWWSLVFRWFSEFCGPIIVLWYNHKEKVLYILIDGWTRVVWFVIDRFEIVFGAIENHLDGWAMFASNPAQALWDWVEPQLRVLVARFLEAEW